MANDTTDSVIWGDSRGDLLPIVISGIVAAVLALLCSVCLCVVLESGRKRPFGRLETDGSWRRRKATPEPAPRDLSGVDLQIDLRVLTDLRDLNRSEAETDLEVAKLTYFGSDVVQLLKRIASSESLASLASSAPSAAGAEASAGTRELPSQSQHLSLAASKISKMILVRTPRGRRPDADLLEEEMAGAPDAVAADPYLDLALPPVQASDMFTRGRSAARVERPRPSNLPSLTGPQHKSAPDLPSLALGHVDRLE